MISLNVVIDLDEYRCRNACVVSIVIEIYTTFKCALEDHNHRFTFSARLQQLNTDWSVGSDHGFSTPEGFPISTVQTDFVSPWLHSTALNCLHPDQVNHNHILRENRDI